MHLGGCEALVVKGTIDTESGTSFHRGRPGEGNLETSVMDSQSLYHGQAVE